MKNITRREFMEVSAKLAAMMGLGASAIPRVANALEKLSGGAAPVVWLQGQSCSGCSVSLLDSENPGPAALLTKYISLQFHSNVSSATGEVSMNVMNKCISTGGYFLAVEGSIPAKMPSACIVGHEPITEQVIRAAQGADAVLAIGTCAAFGGIPAAEGNVTGAVNVADYLKEKGVTKPVIRLPGCPTHPDWMVGTLVHVLEFGLPELDDKGRPTMFYGKPLHELCPRFADFEAENFATTYNEDGCLFELGCLGPNTEADCTTRLWNGGTNSCINAGAPCIGCAGEDFALSKAVSFSRKVEHQKDKQ